MSKYAIEWDKETDRQYETGIDQGVLFVMNGNAYGDAVAWSGLTGVTETPSGAEETALYADNIKFIALKSKEDFGGTIEAYMYPPEWEQCDGSAELEDASGAAIAGVIAGQQERKTFGLCYRTKIGHHSGDFDYKYHFVYNATASVSERAYASVNDSPEAITFSWEFTTTPTEIGEGFDPTSIITVDTSKLSDTTKANLDALLEYVYGKPAGTSTEAVPGKLPTPAQIVSLLTTGAAA